MIGLDWSGLMQAGLHGLRLHPHDFWALTPAELQVMLGVSQTRQAMRRDRLEQLLRAYPDKPKDTNDG